MPEIRFQIQWPDGSQELCYSPSLIVKEYFTPAQLYTLEDFVERSRTALMIASDRVQAKYGMPCTLALAQLQKIEQQVAHYQQTELANAQVKVLRFVE
jgi:uncharacterized repeat protein (TIGR04042 family)